MLEVFNSNNKGYVTGKYPLFLGDKLGLYDSVNVVYPDIEELYQQQFGQRWSEFEYDLTQDKMDMLKLPKETTALMVETIMWQYTADSIAAKSLSELLLPHITNSEFEAMVTIQSFFEIIHSRTYAHIVKQTIPNANELLEKTYASVEVIKRSQVIGEAFSSLSKLTKDSSRKDKMKALLKVMFALMAFEGINFMSSFAVTFAIVETGVFQGISGLVGLICFDELLHAKMDYTVIKNLLKDPEWYDVFVEIKPEINTIMDEVIQQEFKWTEHLFSEGRRVVGLSPVLLREFVVYMATPLYKSFGLSLKEGISFVDKNPLPYMNKYLKSGVIQVAAQEVQLSDYNVGNIVDDTDNLDLSFEV
jgi:ribonucleoside-diphosphate reductase beta chain